MTVQAFNHNAVPWYTCVSGDTKPTDATVLIGSLAVETDTENWFIYDGSAWHAATPNVGSNITVTSSALPTGAATQTTLASVLSALTGGQGLIFQNVAAHSITASTPFDLWTPASGKKYAILGWQLSVANAASIIFKNKHSASYTEFLRTGLLPAATAMNSPVFTAPVISPAVANDVLALDVTVTGAVSGFVFGQEL